MRRAFKYRLVPNETQKLGLATLLETHRRLYNQCLEMRIDAYKTEQKTLSAAEQSRWYTAERKVNPWYGQTTFSSAREAIDRLEKAFKAFFRRVKAGQKPGFPRFKGRDRYDSFIYQVDKGVKLIGDRLRIQHVGSVKVRLHREILGTVKTVAIKREADHWYVVFSCDLGDVPVEPSTNPPVGIDVGLESFLTTSDGEHEPNPRYLKAALPELRRRGRAVARKKRGGKNRRKARMRLAKQHRKVSDCRRDHHHKTALNLVRRHGLIAVEDLNIRGMIRGGWFSRAISDVAWGNFLSTLRSKAESAGVEYVEVDARGTSQRCSGCGSEVRKELSVRRHECPHCGLTLHRDENAARNILARGLTARVGPAGVNVGHQAERPPRSRSPLKVLPEDSPIEDRPKARRPTPGTGRKAGGGKVIQAEFGFLQALGEGSADH